MSEYHPTLLYDTKLLDFNFCSFLDPSLTPGEGPDESWLYRMAYLARLGVRYSRASAGELADTIERTLSQEAFDSFQHTQGYRPIRYADWHHSKLYQFLSVLLYQTLYEDQVQIGLDWKKLTSERPWDEKTGYLTASVVSFPDDIGDIGDAFPIDQASEENWYPLVLAVSQAEGDRVEALRRTLAERGHPGAGTTKSARLTLRDNVVSSCLEQKMSRREVCEKLDEKAIETTPNMLKHGIARWVDAWDDREFRKDVQQMISKALRKAENRVKG